MVYTELAPRRQQFHVAPAMTALKYTTSVDIKKRKKERKKEQKTRYIRAQWVCSRRRRIALNNRSSINPNTHTQVIRYYHYCRFLRSAPCDSWPSLGRVGDAQRVHSLSKAKVDFQHDRGCMHVWSSSGWGTVTFYDLARPEISPEWNSVQTLQQ